MDNRRKNLGSVIPPVTKQQPVRPGDPTISRQGGGVGDVNIDLIAQRLGDLKFKKALVGGVNEEDVWRKLDKLDAMYKELYVRQRAYYEALLRRRGNR